MFDEMIAAILKFRWLIVIGIIAALSLTSWLAIESRAHWKAEAKLAVTALNHIKEQSAAQQEEINNYVQKLNDINERHNARSMFSMSCAIAPAESPDGEGNTPRSGNPYPAISAYIAACERVAAKLEAFQNLYRGE